MSTIYLFKKIFIIIIIETFHIDTFQLAYFNAGSFTGKFYSY